MNYRDLKDQELPYQGEFFFAHNRKHQELIFFVHFYEGSKRKLLRHIRFVNQLGFDAFAFNLSGDFRDLEKFKLPITPNKKFGLKHSYAYQVQTLLELIPGKKIVYSFSNPSASAIEAIRAINFKDIQGLICDSGPSGHFNRSGFNLFSTELRDRVNFKFFLMLPLISLSWSPFMHWDVRGDLKKFPQGFPIFTIEGGKDNIIPPHHIEAIFQGLHNLHWEKVLINEAQHLTGLRDCKAEYEPPVADFLQRIGTNLET